MERIINEVEKRKVEIDLNRADLYEIVDLVLPECLEMLKERGLSMDSVLVSGFYKQADGLRAAGFEELFLTDMETLADPEAQHNPLRYAIEESGKKDRKFIRLYDVGVLQNYGEIDSERDFYKFSSKDQAESSMLAQIEIVQSR